MGDISNETSMEDILSSIKRIIAEEGEGSAQALRGRKSIRTAQARDMDDRDEILELNQSVAPSLLPGGSHCSPITIDIDICANELDEHFQ